MEIKRKDVTFISEWRPILGGKIYAKIVFSTWESDWVTRDCRKIQNAEIISESLFNELRDKYL